MQIFKTHTHASKWLPKVPPRDPVWPTRIGKKEASGDGIEAAPGKDTPPPPQTWRTPTLRPQTLTPGGPLKGTNLWD